MEIVCLILVIVLSIDQILKHEEALDPENERYTKEQLEDFFKKYDK